VGFVADVTIRPAVDADVATLDEITRTSESSGDAAERPPGVHNDYFAHLVRRGRVLVAVRDGTAVGFGAAVDTGRARHLADLFVRRSVQGGGIGGRLLAELYEDAWPRTTFGSDDPRAVPLYLRAGMQAYWPDLYLDGDPSTLPAVDGLTVVDAPFADVAELEHAWAGVDRTPDLPYWSTLPDARPFVVRRAGRTVGAGIGRARLTGSGRSMHEAMAAPGEDGPGILLAALRHGLAGSTLGGGCVPGASPLARRLLELGFRVVDRDTFLASDPRIVDPEREIVNTGIL